jgi:DNA polymerase
MLNVLREEIKNCHQCGLCEYMPLGPVTSVGPELPSILIVGEAPGEDESIAEEPFVGLAGQLLNKLLNNAGLKRDSILIANVVNCRPTLNNEWKKNRPPSRTEIKACQGWLFKQIEVTKPKLIFTLGKIPTYVVLGLKPTFKLHDYIGKVQKYNEIDVIPNLHPSYVLQYGRSEVELSTDIFRMGLKYIQ